MSKQILYPGASSSHSVEEADDEVIILSNVDNSNLISRLQLSLVGRMFHKEGRSLEALVALLPKENIWDVEGRVRGVVLGNSRFQFDFDSEADLQKVLRRRPCHFNKWSFSLERWEPHVGNDFPNSMTFWVRTEGIPRHFWVDELLSEFGGALGVVRNVDAATGRIQLTVRADEPLKFKRKAQIPTGECVMVYLTYEKLHRWCSFCSRLCHEKDSCPLLLDTQRHELEAAPLPASVEATSSLGNQTGRDRSTPSWWRGSPTRYVAKGRYIEPNSLRVNNTKNKQSAKSSSSAKNNFDSRVDKGETRRRLGKTSDKALSIREPSHTNVWRRQDSFPQSRKSGRGDSNHRVNDNNIPRPRETPLEGDIAYRKRSFEEAVSTDHQRRDSNKGRVSKTRVTPDTLRQSSAKVYTQIPLPESQVTTSDRNLVSVTAKQGYVSPALVKERPFRLKLSKKYEIGARAKGKEKEGELGSHGESSVTGSAAKKSLNFDTMDSGPLKLKSQIQIPPSTQSPLVSNLKSKSWYEITIEEEEEEAERLKALALTPASVRNSIPRTSPAVCQEDPLISTPFEFDALDPMLESNLNDLQLDDVNENGMEWDLPVGVEEGVDLELGEEDELAYRESDYLLEEEEGDFETGVFPKDDNQDDFDFENDDLLEDEFYEEEAATEAEAPEAEAPDFTPDPTPVPVAAISLAATTGPPASDGPHNVAKPRKAHSGTKTEQKLKGPAGPSSLTGVASRKLSKASPMKRSHNLKSGLTKPRTTRKAATIPRSEVFPSTKSKTPSAKPGQAGSSDPSQAKS